MAESLTWDEFDQSQPGRERRVRDLPTFYYHGHFVEMLTFVREHYAHVLDESQQRFIDDFSALGRDAQCLYVRLVNRKGRLFSAKNLRYPELGRTRPLLEELHAAGFVRAPEARHFDDLLRHLKRATLYDLLSARFAGLPKSIRKGDLVTFALTHCEAESFVHDVRASNAGSVLFTQARTDPVTFLCFLYFGRAQDGLSQFTMRDLGLVRVNGARHAFEARFAERDEALEHFAFAKLLKRVETRERHELLTLVREAPEWPAPEWPAAAALRDQLVERLGRKLEKLGDGDLALDIYRRGESSTATERLVRMLLTAGRRDEAQSYLESLMAEPRNDEEKLFAHDLYARKFEKKRTSTLTDTLRAAETIDIDESLSGAPERAAAQYFEAHGARAFRVENALWRTLFGLTFWDLLVDTDGAAVNSPFEFLPAALVDGQFAATHADAIEECLAELDDRAAFARSLLKISTARYGTPNGIFRWRRGVLDALFEFVAAAPPDGVRSILLNFCRDYQGSRYGYPDLLLIEQGRPRFVEIKTDGDCLRRNQMLRLEQLRNAGFDADVVRIRWTLDPKQVYVVVDVETTGGKGANHRVTEIGAVKVQGGQVIDRFSTLLNPQRTIPPGITRLTGISEAMVRSAPYFVDIADDFEAFMGDAIFVAHNVEFDYRFISAEFKRLGRSFRHAKLCTCASMRKLYPGHRSYSLNALCAAYDIPLKNHHRALCDAEAAAELLLLVNEKRASGLVQV
ncbi:MAG: exonuclease domain-containing protein [Pseudomonadota bacterium]